LINLLADRVLLAAFSKKLRPVPSAFVGLKAKEMSSIPEIESSPPISRKKQRHGREP